jgi:glutathione S-transferase
MAHNDDKEMRAVELAIGDKRYSSWSMRPWLALKRTGQPFTETLIRLRREETRADILKAGSPTGQVPFLRDGEVVIWDSLAISEYLAERYPEARLWPVDITARAMGRAAAAEMHAGFHSLRGECPMDLAMQETVALSEATETDIRRLVALWTSLRGRFEGRGPYLLGEWSIADAFFTPVATRFRSYGVRLSDYGDRGAAGTYAEALLESPEFKAWEAGVETD